MSGGAFNAPVHPLVQMRQQVPQVTNVRPPANSFSSDLTELDLNKVNINEPRF